MAAAVPAGTAYRQAEKFAEQISNALCTGDSVDGRPSAMACFHERLCAVSDGIEPGSLKTAARLQLASGNDK
eukprot:scaffold24754_cov135-Isochrysis_galbana.AAC.6